MLNFSFSSVLITVLVSNLLLIVITLCFRNQKLLVNMDYKLLSVFCIVTLVRFLFPLELPFTRTLLLPKTVSVATVALVHSHGEWRGIPLSIWTGFCILWFLGILVLSIRLIREHYKLRSFVRTNGRMLTEREPYAALLAQLCTERQRKRIQICEVANLDVPQLIGFWRPMILLPENADPYSREILYTLRHEISHYTHHDLWLKTAVNILVIGYWWNPFCYILNRQVDTLLEMRVDDRLMSENAESAAAYIESLLHLIRKADSRKRASRQTMGMFFSRRSSLHYRIQMMRREEKQVNHLVNTAIFAIFIAVYVLSHLFIFEGSYIPPEIEEAYMLPSEDNSYAICNEDGLYDIYMEDGFYLETTDSLLYYPQDMIIYSSEEDYHEKKP